eukprot:3927760-Alexandrium_andersonii.AAC.1
MHGHSAQMSIAMSSTNATSAGFRAAPSATRSSTSSQYAGAQGTCERKTGRLWVRLRSRRHAARHLMCCGCTAV